MMNGIENLFEKTVSEIERMLTSKTVVGDPIEIESNTLIPLVNVGGGGVKPVALIIVNSDGVRVDPIKSGTASVFEKVAETFGRMASAKREETTEQ